MATEKQKALRSLIDQEVAAIEQGQKPRDIRELAVKAGYSFSSAQQVGQIADVDTKNRISSYIDLAVRAKDRLKKRIEDPNYDVSDAVLVKTIEQGENIAALLDDRPTERLQISSVIELRELILNARVDLNELEMSTDDDLNGQ